MFNYRHFAWILAFTPLMAWAIPFNHTDFFYMRLDAGMADYAVGNWTDLETPITSIAKPTVKHTRVKVGTATVLGYQLADYPVQFEVSYEYLSPARYKWSLPTHTVSDVKLDTHSLLANVSYAFNSSRALKPFILAGLGYSKHMARASYDDSGVYKTLKSSSNRFAYDAGLGVEYDLTSAWSLRLGMKYSNYGNANIDYLNTSGNAVVSWGKASNIRAISAQLGITYSLNATP